MPKIPRSFSHHQLNPTFALAKPTLATAKNLLAGKIMPPRQRKAGV